MDRAGMRKAKTGGQRLRPSLLGLLLASGVVVASLFLLQPSILTAGSPTETASAPPATADSVGYVTNGTVSAIAHSGSKTFIGSTFTMVGPRTGHGVPISTEDGSPTSGFPDIAGGNVYAVEPDGSGG